MVFELTRRDFLVFNLALGLTMLLRQTGSSVLTIKERRALQMMARTLFPHDRVYDGLYRKAVDAIDDRCSEDLRIFHVVTGGLTALENSSGGDFASATLRKRVEVLKAMESSRFFRVVYRETLDTLYGAPEMWDFFLL